jgi:hypothetical protein
MCPVPHRCPFDPPAHIRKVTVSGEKIAVAASGVPQSAVSAPGVSAR